MPPPAFILRIMCLAVSASAAAFVAGCSIVEKAGPQPTPAAASTGFEADVPRIMRGTIGAETVMAGFPQPGESNYQDTVVRGFGLVVGLKGTGSRDIPPALRAQMLQEMSRRGMGQERTGTRAISPRALLDSPDTAVVVVEAILPPAAREGSRFDVRVYADPRTGAASLEGGRLYTTELRPGRLAPGAPQGFPLAEARGPLFINPFAEPGATGRDNINRTSGRILNGGRAFKDMPLKLRLLTPSHSRSRVIETAINTRYPQERGQKEPTARGESDESITIDVPPSWQQRTDEFVALIRHTTISLASPGRDAMQVRRALERDPAGAAAAALRWQALGTNALPIIQDLYESPQELIRLAALTAGAKLDDALVIPNLIDMTRSGNFETRRQAVELLAGMRISPRIDSALRALLDDEDVEVRLAAYDSLVLRQDPFLGREGVDGKFILDVVESSHPMIYITQVGTPRIVLFGTGLRIETPLLMQTWTNRFMVKAEDDDAQLEVYYRAADAPLGSINKVDADLLPFVRFLGHETTVESPDPGLGLSYAESVGALHQIWSQGHLKADFKAEQDRILAAIMRRERTSELVDRPEFADEDSPWFTPQSVEPNILEPETAPEG